MSVYVGIDVHRKRSQVAVVAEDGKVQVNRNVVNGSEPMLRLIRGLPAGTPAAFEAAYGWGWLINCSRTTGSIRTWCTRCGARDRLSAAEERQGRRRDPGAAAARGPAARRIAPQPVRQLRALLRHRASPG
jgi:transposase